MYYGFDEDDPRSLNDIGEDRPLTLGRFAAYTLIGVVLVVFALVNIVQWLLPFVWLFGR